MPRRRNISAFCPSNRSLFVRPRILFWPPRAVKLTTRCTKGRPDAQRHDLVFPRVPRQWLWWKLDVCERYRGGCRETVRGDFCFDFCDPMRGFADPARVARGSRRCHQAWPHTLHIWNRACMESFPDETTTKRVGQFGSPANSTNHGNTHFTILNLSSGMAALQTWKLSVENGLLSRNTKITAVEINIAVDWNTKITAAVRINIAQASQNTKITTVETNWRYLSVVEAGLGLCVCERGLVGLPRALHISES